MGFIRFDPGGGNERIQRASGFGDIELLGRVAAIPRTKSNTSLYLEGGVALPTGQSNRSAAQTGVEAPPNILSLGRGVFGLRGRITLSRFFNQSLGMRIWAGAGTPLSANSANILFGTRFGSGVGAVYLPAPHWVLAPQLSASGSTHARSTINGQLVNSGGRWLNAEMIASWKAKDNISVSATARLPLYRSVNGSQITESFTGIIQFGFRLGHEKPTKTPESDEDHQPGQQSSPPI